MVYNKFTEDKITSYGKFILSYDDFIDDDFNTMNLPRIKLLHTVNIWRISRNTTFVKKSSSSSSSGT